MSLLAGAIAVPLRSPYPHNQGKSTLDFGDRVVGGDGDDLLMVGTGGGNLITGGSGADVFAIANNGVVSTAVNTITDFEAGENFISINKLGASFANMTLSAQNGDTLVSIPILLKDLDVAFSLFKRTG